MAEKLSQEELNQLSRLAYDVDVAYQNSTVTPENRADCEAIRRSIRDRLKPYMDDSSPSYFSDGLLKKVVRILKG